MNQLGLIISRQDHREPEHVIRDENKCIFIHVCPCVFFSRLEET